MKHGPLVLAVLDGWGCSEALRGNAIAAAKLPHWRAFFERYPWTMLHASGEAVGLPKGIMGNSEVGHMNLGSGRVVPQGVVVINADITTGDFARNPVLLAAIEHVRAGNGRLHLMGLVSDGCVHSSFEHLVALIDAAAAAHVDFAIDAFLDGRDTPPRSADGFVARLESKLREAGHPDAVATVTGRYYAMDRDKRWERTQLAYDALASGIAPHRAVTASEAVALAYARGEDDEFVLPTIVGTPRPIDDGDAVIFFNFRPDRARQLTLAFTRPGFSEFPVKRYARLFFATMTKYEEDFDNPVLFGPRPQRDTFGEVLSREGLRQLRLAETEKYAHVTYFFNGGREEVFEGEDRELIPSDRSVPTYDLAPRMRAQEITDFAIADLQAHRHDAIVMNYANADMVGHTGKWKPTIAAVEILDTCLQRLADAVLAADGLLVVTADHGNAEEKLDERGNPLTAHTTNPVPLILIGNDVRGHFTEGGKLGDVAPTLLSIAELPIPAAMTGNVIFQRDPVSAAT
ncbi:MAG: 2,3-bisphosphoglycerate-independent phosphoglycerate mutase [Candidatus Eremiobacteraeota bacterium]|nr:2,3-bisphosphoglycerate-independent phosphoglycerate mutase [Candidatus Eremiobacteraeota bacterium]